MASVFSVALPCALMALVGCGLGEGLGGGEWKVAACPSPEALRVFTPKRQQGEHRVGAQWMAF